jgi:hypothetical protein
MADSMRSLNSFGVAGMIDAEGEILYTNELRARNVGRIADLLSAKLRQKGADELKVRSSLVYGLFLSYALRGLENRHLEEVDPVSVEVGIDGTYVAIGFGFHWEPSKPPAFEGLRDRVAARKGADAFERIVGWLAEHGTQVILRYEMKERRLEAVALFHRTDDGIRDPLMIVEVDSGSAPLLEVSSYVEIGDLDYSKLLRPPTIADAMEEQQSDVVVVRGGPVEAGTEEFHTAGAPVASGEEVQVVGGTLADEGSEEFRFSSDGPAKTDDGTSLMIEEYERTIGELRDTIHSLEQKLEHAAKGVDHPRASAAPGAGEEDTVVLVKGAGPEVDQPAASTDPSHHDAEVILRALQNLASESRSKKIEETFREIETAVDEKRARKWLENLTTELVQEKGRIGELHKELSRQFSKRELDFKVAEGAMAQEIRQRDDLIRQKDYQLEQKQEQLAQANVTIERLNSRASDREAQQMKAKLERTQRIAQMKEEEAKSLVVKIRDLENRLIIAQAKSQKAGETQAQGKIQGLERKLEEYKRINARLMETLNSHRDSSSDKEASELRRKNEQLDRAFNDAKRALERANFRVRELQENEKKIQAEASRVAEELRALKKAQARSGNDGSDGQAA